MRHHNVVEVVVFIFVSFWITGCATDPRTVPAGERDSESYVIPEKYATKVNDIMRTGKDTVAVLVDAGALIAANLVDSFTRTNIEQNLQAELNSCLDSLSYYRVIAPGSVLGALTAEEFKRQFMSGESLHGSVGAVEKMEIPRYTFVANVVYVSSRSDTTVRNLAGVAAIGQGAGALASDSKDLTIGLGAGAAASAAGALLAPSRVEVKVEFVFYDKEKHCSVLTKTIKREVPGVASGSIPAAIIQGVEECAQEYITLLADKLGPRGVVLETTGNGKFALISLGEAQGVTANTFVNFIEIKEYKNQKDEDGIPERTIASGTVSKAVPVENEKCWIEVKDSNKVRVKEGHIVKIVYQKQKVGFLNRIGM